MNKRSYCDEREQPQHKKQKHDASSHNRKHHASPHLSNGYGHRDVRLKEAKPTLSYEEALAQLPPPTMSLPPVAAYTPFTTPPGLPPLPEIEDESLRSAPFRHKSTTTTYNRSTTSTTLNDVTYETLEFLGDAHLEHLASRLLYTHFPHLTTGQLSQLREQLVKNETLASYARAYGFDKRVQVGDVERMVQDTREKGGKGNKGFNKVLGDVFEAYVAAVVVGGGDEGWGVAEKWMQGLWAVKLVEIAGREGYFTPGLVLQHDDAAAADPRHTYNPAGKAELQKLILGGVGVKLEYEPYKPSIELKGDQLGQNRHFIAVYLTGYGWKRKLLGTGEGKNKVEAGNWAAQEAMFGEYKGVVENCAQQMAVIKEERRRERGAREAREGTEKGEKGGEGEGTQEKGGKVKG